MLPLVCLLCVGLIGPTGAQLRNSVKLLANRDVVTGSNGKLALMCQSNLIEEDTAVSFVVGSQTVFIQGSQTFGMFPILVFVFL